MGLFGLFGRKKEVELDVYKRQSYTFIGIITKNGDYVTIEKVNSDIEKIAVDSLLKNFPEFKNSVDVLKNVFSKSFFKMLKEEFEKEVIDKKDFVEYCEI